MTEIFSSEWREEPAPQSLIPSMREELRLKIVGLYNDQQRKFEERNVLWFRQSNANDCGPCMILNLTQFLGIPQALGTSPANLSVSNIRRIMNERRKEAHVDELGPNAWVEDDMDIYNYFKEIGLSVRIVTDGNDMPLVLKEGRFDAITSGAQSHFVAYVRSQDNTYLELNSLQNNPAVINKETLLQKLEANKGTTMPRVMLVSKP